MFVDLKSLSHILLLPPGALLLLAVVAFGCLFTRFRQPATIVLGVALGLLWLLAVPKVSEGLWRLTEGYPPLDPAKPVDAQAIVVIGGYGFRWQAPEYGGAPIAHDALLERVTYAAYLAHRTHLPVLVSGAPREAPAMQATLERNFGVKVRWLESHSRDTYENAAQSVKLLRADGISRIILVTSATHIWRAAHEFMDTGLEVTPAPAVMWTTGLSEGISAYLPDAQALARSHEAIYELVGNPVRVIMSGLHIRRHTTDGRPLPAAPAARPAP